MSASPEVTGDFTPSLFERQAQMNSLNEAEVLAVLRGDQFKRWHRGERVPLEKYLVYVPGLKHRPEAVLDLLYSEVLLREELGERPQITEYCTRFPQHQDAIRRQFAVHAMLGSSRTLRACDDSSRRRPCFSDDRSRGTFSWSMRADTALLMVAHSTRPDVSERGGARTCPFFAPEKGVFDFYRAVKSHFRFISSPFLYIFDFRTELRFLIERFLF